MRGCGEDRAGEADELPLAEREVLAALLQHGVVAVFEPRDEVVRADGPAAASMIISSVASGRP